VFIVAFLSFLYIFKLLLLSSPTIFNVETQETTVAQVFRRSSNKYLNDDSYGKEERSNDDKDGEENSERRKEKEESKKMEKQENTEKKKKNEKRRHPFEKIKCGGRKCLFRMMELRDRTIGYLVSNKGWSFLK